MTMTQVAEQLRKLGTDKEIMDALQKMKKAASLQAAH